MKQYCPALFEFPAEPIAWHDVHVFYSSNRTDPSKRLPDFICFNKQSSDQWNSTMVMTKLSNPIIQLSCQIFREITKIMHDTPIKDILDRIRFTFERFSALSKIEAKNNCPETTHFQCGKRCISKHRLIDGEIDCFDNSDEDYTNSCSLNDKYRIFCEKSASIPAIDACLLQVFWKNRHGEHFCNIPIQKQIIHFRTLCDGYTEKRIKIDGQIETDEMNCEAWLCDNQYTRCDGIWNCLNGKDEIGCPHSYCETEKGHPCLLWNTSQPICLPISRAGDGIVDCIGGTDEQYLCRNQALPIVENQIETNKYQCWSNHSMNLQAASR